MCKITFPLDGAIYADTSVRFHLLQNFAGGGKSSCPAHQNDESVDRSTPAIFQFQFYGHSPTALIESQWDLRIDHPVVCRLMGETSTE
jgi:hypothetical protein